MGQYGKKSFLKLWLPVIIYAIIIFWGSSQESPFGVIFSISGIDIILHIAEYSVLGILLSRAIAGSAQKVSIATLIFAVFAIGTLYGITDEFHQYFTPGRYSSVLDLASDAIGSFLGAVIFVALFRNSKAMING